MRTSKAMHDTAAPYLYPAVIRVSPELSASLKQKLNPAPRCLSLVRRLEFYAQPWGERSVWATCSPRVLRINDRYGDSDFKGYFDSSHLENVIVGPLLFSRTFICDHAWRWMSETALRVIFVCPNPVNLHLLPSRRGEPTPPDARIGAKTKSLTIVFTPRWMDDDPTEKGDTSPRIKQNKKLSWVRVVANYLCTVPPGIPVTLVGLETHNTYGLECPSVQKALTTTKDYVASHVEAVCEASGRKDDTAAILKRLRFFDMRTWVDSELDEGDISKVEARKWVTDWDAFSLGQAARALKPKTKKPRRQWTSSDRSYRRMELVWDH